MRKEISDLVAAHDELAQRNATLQAKVEAEVANSNSLKAALNAALQGQLTDVEKAALLGVTQGMGAVSGELASAAQKLADSAAANNPSN